MNLYLMTISLHVHVIAIDVEENLYLMTISLPVHVIAIDVEENVPIEHIDKQ